MKLFDVYPLFDITPVRAEGAYVWDENGTRYLDFYGGHAVISIGHSHPHYIKLLTEQLQNIGFYSNSVKIPQQQQLASLLGRLSGYDNYQLFLCNSGAEANENALKLASFKNGKKKVVAFQKSFHGRTSLAVAATDDTSIQAPVNRENDIVFLPLNDEAALERAFIDESVCAVIIEGIQGVGGIHVPAVSFLRRLRELCSANDVALILDEIQSGYGRSGYFFAHQYAAVKADMVTVAKGMGNGFPVGGVLISPDYQAKHGLLGTTFGGNYLACAAAVAVLEVMQTENMMENARNEGNYLIEKLQEDKRIKAVRGMGLMIGIEFDFPIAALRNELLKVHKLFTGTSSNKNTLRLLPPLCITRTETEFFLKALNESLENLNAI